MHHPHLPSDFITYYMYIVIIHSLTFAHISFACVHSVLYCRRDDSLDVDVEASGYMKQTGDQEVCLDDVEALDTAFESQIQAESGEDSGAEGGGESFGDVEPEISRITDSPPAADETGDSACISDDTSTSAVQCETDGLAAALNECCYVEDGAGGEDPLSDDEKPNNWERRPFCDDSEHINAHLMREIQRGKCSGGSVAYSSMTSVAPEDIRRRVKSALKLQQQKQQARRIRKRGEAALQTKNRRNNDHDVKTSLEAGWY